MCSPIINLEVPKTDKYALDHQVGSYSSTVNWLMTDVEHRDTLIKQYHIRAALDDFLRYIAGFLGVVSDFRYNVWIPNKGGRLLVNVKVEEDQCGHK